MKRLAAFLGLFLLVSTARAGVGPDAGRTVVRAGGSLADHLAAATRSAWEEPGAARPVAIVVDVTPNTRAGEDGIRRALESLGDRIRHLDGSWRIGPLGGKLGPPSRHPSKLALEVAGVLAEETEERDTLKALSTTLAGFGDRGGVVVYLADWHFEDDEGLEALVSRFRAKDQVFHAIGSEAAFNRGWTDPFGSGLIRLGGLRYEEGVGRNPFGPNPPEEPWHGGDTAFPHHPWVFGCVPWKSAFPLGSDLGRGEPEDLADRIRSFSDESGGYLYPLASSWGPYGLMRLAAETGGNYRLFSFNPSGRTDVVYDYARCNLFPPDLRSRREILRDVRSNPLVSALARAWIRLADRDCGLVSTTAPVSEGGAPREMAWGDAPDPGMGWRDEAGLAEFLRTGEDRLRAADRALAMLDGVLDAPVPRQPPYSRYRADAEYFRHVVACLRFELAEAIATARAVPPDAFAEEDVLVTLLPVTWLAAERDPERVRPVPGVEPRDPEEGEAVAAARADHLRRYGGTPFGEAVARNEVVTFRVRTMKIPEGSSGGLPPGLTPSESGRDPDPTPRPRVRPGGSTGGGPASGR